MFVIPCVVKSCSLWSSYGKPTIVHCNSEDKASMSIFHLSIVIYLQSHYYSACISFLHNLQPFLLRLPGGGGGGRRLGWRRGDICSLVPLKNLYFPLFPKMKILIFYVSHSPELNGLIPLFPKTPGRTSLLLRKLKSLIFFFKPMNKIKLGTWVVLTNCIESWQNLEDFFLLGNIPGKNDFLKAVHIHWWFGSIISYSAYKLGFGAL